MNLRKVHDWVAATVLFCGWMALLVCAVGVILIEINKGPRVYQIEWGEKSIKTRYYISERGTVIFTDMQTGDQYRLQTPEIVIREIRE